MNKYTLVLKRITAVSQVPVKSFEVTAENNLLALLQGDRIVQDLFKEDGYELIDAGMWVGDDTSERNMVFVKGDETFDYILVII